MTDLALDAANDIQFSGGQLLLVNELEYVAQRLRLRLSIQRGDWFLDLLFGIPWRSTVLVRGPNLVEISALFREQITSTPEITRLVEFSLTFDNTTGLLELDFYALTPFGGVTATAQADNLAALITAIILTPSAGIA